MHIKLPQAWLDAEEWAHQNKVDTTAGSPAFLRWWMKHVWTPEERARLPEMMALDALERRLEAEKRSNPVPPQ